MGSFPITHRAECSGDNLLAAVSRWPRAVGAVIRGFCISPLASWVRAIQPLPYRAGLAEQGPKRLRFPFRFNGMRLSPLPFGVQLRLPGEPFDPEVPLRTSPASGGYPTRADAAHKVLQRIADHAQIAVSFSEQRQQPVLGVVDVLVFVNEDVPE